MTAGAFVPAPRSQAARVARFAPARWSRAPRLAGVAAVLALLALLALGAAALEARAARAGEIRLTARAVDTLLIGRATRLKDLEKWAKTAEVADLVWLLRRPADQLNVSEPVLAAAAWQRTPAERTALRARLAARFAPDSRNRRGGGKSLPAAPPVPPARPRASVFRVGALLPDSGDYADYARAVGMGVEAGLRSVATPGDRPIEFEFWGTGDEDPARLAETLEAASWRNGVLVGELLSVSTIALATGARIAGLPVISPTGTDEAIGTVSDATFQIGPSGWQRGERLAKLLVDRPGLKVGALTSGNVEKNALARGFLAAAESLGAVAAWRSGYNPGTAFRDEVRIILARKLDVLLWEGEPREAEALLREMTRQKVSLRLCGGEGLMPDRFHAEPRVLLEGVHVVGEDWQLPDPERAQLDSALRVRGVAPPTVLHTRGWLAGRAIAEAIASGALCPEEVAAYLDKRRGSTPWLRTHGFLDVARDGATIPVHVVQRGRAVAVP